MDVDNLAADRLGAVYDDVLVLLALPKVQGLSAHGVVQHTLVHRLGLRRVDQLAEQNTVAGADKQVSGRRVHGDVSTL